MERKVGITQNPTSSLFCFGESNSQSSFFDPNNPSETSIAEKHANSIENPSFLEAANKINSDDPKLQFEGLKSLSEELEEENTPINEIIQSGICERILSLASNNHDEKFLFEAAGVFSNILSGNSRQTSYLVNLNVIPFLFTLLDKNNDELNDQVMRAFGNIAGDNPEWRDLIISDDNFGRIADLCNNANFSNASMIKIYSWAITNILRGSPSIAEIVPLALFLAKVITEMEDEKCLIEATWGCYHMTYINPELETFQKQSFLEKLIKHLSSKKIPLVTASLQTLGNVISQMENSSAILFRFGFLAKIEALLGHQKKNIRKDACCVLLNAAESSEVVDKFLENKIYEKLLSIIMKNDGEGIKEAIRVISNSASVCEENQIVKLAQLGIVKGLIHCLRLKICRKYIFEALHFFVKKVPDVVDNEESDRLIGDIDLMIECGEEYEHVADLKEMLQSRRNNSQSN